MADTQDVPEEHTCKREHVWQGVRNRVLDVVNGTCEAEQRSDSFLEVCPWQHNLDHAARLCGYSEIKLSSVIIV